METEVKLTKLAACAGCGAKVGAGTLAKLLDGFRTHSDPRLLVGYDKSDDASVYYLDEHTALVQTTDFYANPTFLPEIMQDEYDKYWTDKRINRVLDVLHNNGIALEINSRYKLPSYKIIRMAKKRGIKFTFGTNNENSDFGRSEYAINAVKECGLTAADIWFPTMSNKSKRKAVNYNHIGDPHKAPTPIAELKN